MTELRVAPPWLRLLGGLIMGLSLAFSPPVLAQDSSGDEDDEDAVDEITVTGSRLKRDTYNSIAPLQVISGQISREVGLIDAGDILQESTAASGQQIDLTFGGFVLDNGPGATTLNLRGLGAARTLVLINGRRVAPAGVEGAPVSADLSLVPASLVQQYDLLLDGASSIYGSDAVAGVTNIIMRKDFDGFEFEGYTTVPEYSNGVENTLSAIWGKNFDRGFIGFGAEYVDSETVTLDDRPWTDECRRHAEIDENGRVRTEEQFDTTVFGMISDGCTRNALAGRVSVPFAGSIYYTPGFSNGGWQNFSESSIGRIGIDGNGDGVTDVNFRDHSINGREQFATLLPEVTQQSFMAYGEYTFEGEANITPFFEVLYGKREFFSNSGAFQLFPFVPGGNPFNICNPAAPGGVDCGDAYDAFLSNPNFINQTLAALGCDPTDPNNNTGCPALTGPIGGGATVRPIVSVRDDRTTTDVEADQIRFVGGVRGDLPFVTAGSLSDWSFELSGVYSKSTGTSSRVGVREDRLDLSQGWFSTTNTPCENDTATPLEADVAPGCIPVNLFAPSLYEGVVGDFATAAERNYLFDSRDFDTEYEQTLISYYMTGNLFDLPAGTVAGGIGLEWREDQIRSIPDTVAETGLFFGFFSDGGAEGSKTTEEAFAEIELPVLANVPGAEELTLNLSGRWTNDEFYGSEWTYSGKLGWRPVESLLVRGTVGTSYRAPNLRELFLRSQSGFGNISDPCFIPEEALNLTTGAYIPALDTRDQRVLDNCVAQGVDPTMAANNGFNNYSVEQIEGGSLTLDEETSDSFSVGLVWDQPFTNAFDLSISTSYYEIDIDGTIIEPSGQFIVNDCFNSRTGNSAFCSRIQRDLADPTQPFIDFIDQGFLNRDNEKTRGVDYNIAFDDTFTVFDRPIELGIDLAANRLLERSTLFIDDEGNLDADELKGEFGFPEWTYRLTVRFDMDDWRLTWQTRYLSSVEQDEEFIDEFSDINSSTGAPRSDTCLGPPTDVLCRDIGFADSYDLHHVSLFYYGDRWTFGGGIRNVFDEDPPFVDGDESGVDGITIINNTPIGYSYDVQGRTYFANIAVSFGGGE